MHRKQTRNAAPAARWIATWRAAANSFMIAIACAIVIECAPLAYAQDQPPADATQLAAGRADFMTHCAPCHGTNAKGHGPEVNVIPDIKPADLTLIERKNGGVFPTQDVIDTIDGRKKIPSHERFDMPFWGVNFQEEGKEFTPESEAKANARMQAIVSYIETIQAK